MDKICKNCANFKQNDITKSESIGKGFELGYCSIMPFSLSEITKDKIAIECGWDSLIFIGESFGCIHFKDKV